MIEPHGGQLVDRTTSEERAQTFMETPEETPAIRLDEGQYQDALNIATGRLSPLRGFLTRNDFLKVAHDMALEDGTVWPLPVTLDIDAETAGQLTPDESAILESPSGESIGIIDVQEVYKYNKNEIAEAVFDTNDRDHPGVNKFLDQEDFLVGGPIEIFDANQSNSYDLLPAESRVLFNHYDWETVVGFQTRNAPHRAHEYIQKSALEFVDGLLIQPKIGGKKSGDYRDEVIVQSYQILMDEYYPEQSVALSVFPSRMRYAGPREAIFDAIVRKNHGCTHFIIGRDHAGVADYYDGFEAHSIFDEIDTIGIQPLFFSYAFYCQQCDGMASDRICPHGDEARIYPSGSKLREHIGDGEQPSARMMRPEVAKFIIEYDQPFIA